MEWMISTDMDGTLLNHDDYRWDAAGPCLNYLEQHNIPVILNTSKTYAEVSDWVKQLNIRHPFIIENGSAIYCPEDYFDPQLIKQSGVITNLQDGYLCIRLGVHLTRLLAFKERHIPEAESLVDCSLARAIEMTGLTEQEAIASQQRHFTVPLLLDEQLKPEDLADALSASQLQLLIGGRFAHLMGLCDKGTSIKQLADLYRLQMGQRPKVLALGDSGNDVAMLQQADMAVVVKNHNNQWLEIPELPTYKTRQQAPEGWVEGVCHMLMENDYDIRSLEHG
jgi:mannosyl-3-phosphoglycerate phosphatase